MQLLAPFFKTGTCKSLITFHSPLLHPHNDSHSGRITYYTHPPEQYTLPTHVSADIVKEWGATFDLVSGWEIMMK